MSGSLDRENVSENNRYSVQLSLRENMLGESELTKIGGYEGDSIG